MSGTAPTHRVAIDRCVRSPLECSCVFGIIDELDVIFEHGEEDSFDGVRAEEGQSDDGTEMCRKGFNFVRGGIVA